MSHILADQVFQVSEDLLLLQVLMDLRKMTYQRMAMTGEMDCMVMRNQMELLVYALQNVVVLAQMYGLAYRHLLSYPIRIYYQNRNHRRSSYSFQKSYQRLASWASKSQTSHSLVCSTIEFRWPGYQRPSPRRTKLLTSFLM